MEAPQTQFLYESVATDVVDLIETGALRAGDRLPSVRRLSNERGVSVSTVLQAYRLLEDRGWIRARPQSGFFVRPRSERAIPEPSKTQPGMAEGAVPSCNLAMEVVESTQDEVSAPLGAATIAPELLPGRAIGRELGRIARSDVQVHLSYVHPQGTPALREIVARRSLYWGGTLAPDDLVVTAGCMEALALSLGAVAGPGDTVIVESPAFFGVLQLLEVMNLRVLEVPSRPRTGVCLDDLAAVLREHGRARRIAACLLTPNYHNPLGGTVPEEKKALLVEMLADAGIPLIEDDLFGDLHHGSERPKPCKAFDRDGNVLYCSSFSKTLAPGLRVGYVAPGRYLLAVRQRKVATSMATSAPGQLALAAYLQRGGYDHHLRRRRGALGENVAGMRAAVAGHFPGGTRVTRPEGGFLLWVELPEGSDAVKLFRAARAQGITTAPGPAFSATGGYRRCLRLSAGHPWNSTIAAGVALLGELAHGIRN